MRYRRSSAAFTALVLIAGLCATSLGGTKLTVDLGWGGQIRNDRWIPVLVTASDDKPRDVMLEINWPTGGTYSMRIEQALTIDAKPRMFRLLVPVRGWAYQEASFRLADRESGKTLAHYPDKESDAYLPNSRSYLNGTFIGISGAKSELGTLQVANPGLTTAFLDPRLAPDAALGYDSLDVLVLNAPNLVRGNFGPPELSDAQQQAIVDWIRAGGKLIIWPGEMGFPSSSPLVDVLPAHVGDHQTLNLSPEEQTAIGLPRRIKQLAAYHLEPKPGAEPRRLLNAGQAVAWSGRVGLGQIVLAPINVAELPIDEASQCTNLWKPLTTGILAASAAPGDAKDDSRDADQRENFASMQIADFLGNVPGAAKIGFSYIAILLIGMMTIVGPVDWFVLKKLGRQPWTWVTTSGWVALVTVGALFAGYIFKSGNLDYKTIQMVDQVDNATVASSDYVSLYSTRTRAYDIKTPADTWWQPAGTSENGNAGLALDIDFHQTSEGNTPEEMAVNVWSLRFLRGDKIGAGPPVIAADLKVASGPVDVLQRHVTGTLTNLTSAPLKNVRVSVQRGSEALTMYAQPSASGPATIVVNEIAPQATVRVDAMVVAGSNAQIIESDDPNLSYPSMRYSYYNAAPPEESKLWKTVADLNVRRLRRMESLAATGKFALIYAETDHAAPVATLQGEPGIERHFEFVRALVELH